MTRAARHLASVAIVIACTAAFPAAVLAAGKGTKPKHSSSCVSAVCVYKEPIPTDTGGYGSSGSGGGSSGGGSSTGGGGVVQLSTKASKALKRQGGKDTALLRRLSTFSGFGVPERLSAPRSTVVGPGALGAAFDLGSGPTALLVALVASTVLLALAGGIRIFRR